MAFTDDIAALKAETNNTLAGFTSANGATLATLLADDAALADLQNTIGDARTQLAALIAAYKAVVTPAPAPAPAPAPTSGG